MCRQRVCMASWEEREGITLMSFPMSVPLSQKPMGKPGLPLATGAEICLFSLGFET